MIALAVLLAAPDAAPAPVTIPVLRAHLHDWNGRRVAVRGWAFGCDWSFNGFCNISPSSKWRKGRGRLQLLPDPHLTGGSGKLPFGEVVVRGTVVEDVCPTGEICFDGEDHLRVDAVEAVGEHRR